MSISRRRHILRVALGTWLIFFLSVTGGKSEPFSEDSPEHQALTLASPTLGDEAFSLRQDYWIGTLSTARGAALRLQFFKGNAYSLFFGVDPAALPKGASLHLNVFNSENEEVASAEGDAGATAVALHLEDTLATGLYLVLMRVDSPPGPLVETEVPAVMFYGWK